MYRGCHCNPRSLNSRCLVLVCFLSILKGEFSKVSLHFSLMGTSLTGLAIPQAGDQSVEEAAFHELSSVTLLSPCINMLLVST